MLEDTTSTVTLHDATCRGATTHSPCNDTNGSSSHDDGPAATADAHSAAVAGVGSSSPSAVPPVRRFSGQPRNVIRTAPTCSVVSVSLAAKTATSTSAIVSTPFTSTVTAAANSSSTPSPSVPSASAPPRDGPLPHPQCHVPLPQHTRPRPAVRQVRAARAASTEDVAATAQMTFEGLTEAAIRALSSRLAPPNTTRPNRLIQPPAAGHRSRSPSMQRTSSAGGAAGQERSRSSDGYERRAGVPHANHTSRTRRDTSHQRRTDAARASVEALSLYGNLRSAILAAHGNTSTSITTATDANTTIATAHSDGVNASRSNSAVAASMTPNGRAPQQREAEAHDAAAPLSPYERLPSRPDTSTATGIPLRCRGVYTPLRNRFTSRGKRRAQEAAEEEDRARHQSREDQQQQQQRPRSAAAAATAKVLSARAATTMLSRHGSSVSGTAARGTPPPPQRAATPNRRES